MSQEHFQEDKETDQYTKQAIENGFSRRSFLSRAAGGAAAAGLFGLSSLPAAAAGTTETKGPAFATSSDGGATLSFLPKPKPIRDREIAETLTFDVVVVGAGASGVPAALSAAENGAKVAVIQKAPFALSQGNTGSGVDLATSEKAGVEALVARLIADSNHRCNPKLIRQWAYHSGEAVKWVIDRAKQGGSPVVDQGSPVQRAILKVNGYGMGYVTSFFGPKPYTTGDGMRHLAKTAEKAGVRFFYRTPAVQLVQNKAGEILGVIAKGR